MHGTEQCKRRACVCVCVEGVWHRSASVATGKMRRPWQASGAMNSGFPMTCRRESSSAWYIRPMSNPDNLTWPILLVRMLPGWMSLRHQVTRAGIGLGLRRHTRAEAHRQTEAQRATTTCNSRGNSTYRRGEIFAPSQIRGGKFRCGKFRGAPWMLCITTRQSPQCGPLVCEKFAENPEFRMGNFAVKLKREISHAKLKYHEPPPPVGTARGFWVELYEGVGLRDQCDEAHNTTTAP